MRHERRKHERHCIPIPAILDTRDGRSKSVRIRDISFTGAFLEDADAETLTLSLGAEVRVTIQYQSEQGTEVETARGRIVRTQPDGIGIEFVRTANVRAA